MTLLRRAVHVDRSNLDFERETIAIADAGVKTLVAVRLGVDDVVLESERLRFEQTMNGVESQVAIVLPGNDDPKGEQILHVLES